MGLVLTILAVLSGLSAALTDDREDKVGYLLWTILWVALMILKEIK